jgi:hypothetical protein
MTQGLKPYKIYKWQCLCCGQGSQSVRPTLQQKIDATEFDESIGNRWQQKMSAYWEQHRSSFEGERGARQREWEDLYFRHVTRRSPRWTALCRLVMARCDRTCEGCGIRPAIQVHHMTYEHLGDEFLWELRGVCRECHERFHGIDSDDDE